MEIDPLYCEISIRRLEQLRATGKRGWQNGNPFETEIATDPELSELFKAAVQNETQQSLFATA